MSIHSTESTTTKQIDRLIINSPYEEPQRYWSYNRESRAFTLIEGSRRPAGYVIATPGSQAFDDPGVFHELPLVNKIRPRVKEWRKAEWPGVTGITRRLLKYWYDSEERQDRRLFFCQLEAMEIVIWLIEAPASERQGIVVPGDGGSFTRLCSKMATGSGKTIVMAMVIAWQVLNKVADQQDKRFSKNVLVIAPGLTVKSRLQVLQPSSVENYYEEFNVVPAALMERLRLGRVVIHNWHKLDWETNAQITQKKGVDKRGAKSDERYVHDVLGGMANARNILVINDEAHHAWRVPMGNKIAGISTKEAEEATKWVGGLDRIHKARGILTCYDFSATPFAPSGKKSSEEALFDWIVSDFGLNDAIESGLVKTPRVVVRDDGVPDARTYKSKLYHIYNDPTVKDDLNRKADEYELLPTLVTNAYYLLGKDWLETAKLWKKAGHVVPPVMITVANRTETAARVKFAFDRGKIKIDELCQPERTLHIDSKVLEEAEALDEPLSVTASAVEVDRASDDVTGADAGDNGVKQNSETEDGPVVKKLTKKQQAELLRLTVDTVGRIGKPGEQIQNVISVGMLSEGWDAKNVTHIMGLRAFTSQLLCEQVVGRGLRRTSYDVNPVSRLFEAEYVNIFGVPFTFLPHEGGDGPPPPPPPPKTKIEPVQDKLQHAISWPNILKIEHVYEPRLHLDLSKVPVLRLNASDTVTLADLAPTVEGKPDVTKIDTIKLDDLARRFRLQKITFEAARDIYDQLKDQTDPPWKGGKDALLVQLIRLVEQFLFSDNVQINPPLFNQEDLRRRLMLTLNMNQVVHHIWKAIRFENTLELKPVFDEEKPIRSTGDMRPWYTGKPCEMAERSHINFCIYDSTWESSESFHFDHSKYVTSWVKNDHLGFEVLYVFMGVTRKFRPDYIVRLTNGRVLVLEVKGRDSDQDRTKREFLAEWTKAVNAHKGFGVWVADVSFHPSDIHGTLERWGNS